jgi:hypothetical protein
MAPVNLNCWHCGTALEDVPLPIGRRDECPHCSSSLHVCRMCDFFDRAASKQCREPMADEVSDKEHANFCDYFRPRSGLTAGADQEAANARARLEALFGGVGGKDSAAAARPRSLARKGAGGSREPDLPEPDPD